MPPTTPAPDSTDRISDDLREAVVLALEEAEKTLISNRPFVFSVAAACRDVRRRVERATLAIVGAPQMSGDRVIDAIERYRSNPKGSGYSGMEADARVIADWAVNHAWPVIREAFNEPVHPTPAAIVRSAVDALEAEARS